MLRKAPHTPSRSVGAAAAGLEPKRRSPPPASRGCGALPTSPAPPPLVAAGAVAVAVHDRDVDCGGAARSNCLTGGSAGAATVEEARALARAVPAHVGDQHVAFGLDARRVALEVVEHHRQLGVDVRGRVAEVEQAPGDPRSGPRAQTWASTLRSLTSSPISRPPAPSSPAPDVEDLLELVEDAVLAIVRRVFDDEREALHRVRSGRKPRFWWPSPKGVSGCPISAWQQKRLTAVPNAWSKSSRVSSRSSSGIARRCACRTPPPAWRRGLQAPQLAGEHDVVRPVDLAPVVPGAGLAREREPVAAAAVLDLEEALRHRDAGRAVLPHRPELDQVGVGTSSCIAQTKLVVLTRLFFCTKTQCPRPPSNMAPMDTAEVDDRLRLELPEDLVHELVVRQVTLPEGHLLPEMLLQRLQALGHRCTGTPIDPISWTQRRRRNASTPATSCPSGEKGAEPTTSPDTRRPQRSIPA